MNKFLSLVFAGLLGCSSQGVTYRLTDQNDFFNPFSKNYDRNYTNGFKLERRTKESSYAIGQNIYTPGNKQNTELQPEDRPYAGYSYIEYRKYLYGDEGQQYALGLQAGIVGPGSGAEDTQRLIHEALGNRVPRGWKHQLRNEPTLQLEGSTNRRAWQKHGRFVDFDLITRNGGRLGNVNTSIETGGYLRVGYNLPPDFSPPRIYPRFGSADNEIRKDSDFSVFGFGGSTLYGVAKNIFLDGNTWQKSHRVTKEPIVLEAQAGVTVRYKKFRFTYSYIINSPEWTESKQWFPFGGVDLEW